MGINDVFLISARCPVRLYWAIKTMRDIWMCLTSSCIADIRLYFTHNKLLKWHLLLLHQFLQDSSVCSPTYSIGAACRRSGPVHASAAQRQLHQRYGNIITVGEGRGFAGELRAFYAYATKINMNGCVLRTNYTILSCREYWSSFQFTTPCNW